MAGGEGTVLSEGLYGWRGGDCIVVGGRGLYG